MGATFMPLLFAHHLELHHIPILVSLFGVGILIGWQNVGWWLKR
jgi:hypothetical protein